MSRFAGLLVALVAGTALAQPAPPPPSSAESEAPVERPARAPRAGKVPLRVVKILGESEQALLFDKHRGRHVLVEVGDKVGDYVVDAIDVEDVTLTGRDQETVVLAAPERPWRRERRANEAPTRAPAPAPAAVPAAPYAPEDPYATDEPVRSVSAAGIDGPAAAGEVDEDVPSVSAAGVPAPAMIGPSAPAPTASPSAPPPAPAIAPSGPAPGLAPTPPPVTVGPTAPAPTVAPSAPADAAPAAPPPPPSALAEELAAEAEGTAPAAPTVISGAATATATPGSVTLARRDVDAALADFGTLAASIRASFGKRGLELHAVAPGSLFARAGLRAGDVITAVDGKPLRSIDDAAALYARAGALKTTTVELRRAGKPQTLRIAIR